MNAIVLESPTNWSEETQSNYYRDWANVEPAIGRKSIIVSTGRLSKKAENILGLDGVKRFEDFKKYHEGWDHGAGKSLSLKSVAVLDYFINQYSYFHSSPSIFFTREGNLQLGWEDSQGRAIEIEFYPDRIEYYLEGKGIESEIPVDVEESKSGLNRLVNELNKL